MTQLGAYLKNLFQEDFLLRKLRVRGEVSNVKYHNSGHIYFTLKDAGGALSAVMYERQREGLSFRLQEGQKVVVTGTVDIYEKRGIYQLYAAEIEEEGQGDLFSAFLNRKREMEEMGMFSELYKKEIPVFSRTVGIVTAPTGAVIRDIISVSKRRNPFVQLILYPALVQGKEAAKSIVRGIETMDRLGVDVIIVGRGGGSIEDLWAFNEREVAQAVFDCDTPIISAVGHETDFTISDFVADLRAPTPSAAAEQAVVDMSLFLEDLKRKKERIRECMTSRISQYTAHVRDLKLRCKLHSPGHILRTERMMAGELHHALRHAMVLKCRNFRMRFETDAASLEALSPLRRLRGGYAYVRAENGKSVQKACDLEQNQNIQLFFCDGTAKARIERINLNETETGETNFDGR